MPRQAVLTAIPFGVQTSRVVESRLVHMLKEFKRHTYKELKTHL